MTAVLLQDTGKQVAVVGYEIQDKEKPSTFMPTPRTYSTSGEAFIVPTEVEPYIATDLVVFGVILQRYRTSQAAAHATKTSE